MEGEKSKRFTFIMFGIVIVILIILIIFSNSIINIFQNSSEDEKDGYEQEGGREDGKRQEQAKGQAHGWNTGHGLEGGGLDDGCSHVEYEKDGKKRKAQDKAETVVFFRHVRRLVLPGGGRHL